MERMNIKRETATGDEGFYMIYFKSFTSFECVLFVRFKWFFFYSYDFLEMIIML